MHFKVTGVGLSRLPTGVRDGAALIVCHSSPSWPIDVLTARIREMIENSE